MKPSGRKCGVFVLDGVDASPACCLCFSHHTNPSGLATLQVVLSEVI
jgi:hypothetical protein